MPFSKIAHRLRVAIGALILLTLSLGLGWFSDFKKTPSAPESKPYSVKKAVWTAPSVWRLMRLDPEQRRLVLYGKDLIAHTAVYLGPKGRVAQISNGMNCQNCHLEAGTKPWGNNYLAVQANYPKFRERSGTVENQIKRINDCIQRSLNGKALDSNSREMQAMLAYIAWLGQDVPKKQMPEGSGIYKLPLLDRAADPSKGALVYQTHCQSCHQADGQGLKQDNGMEYLYPPLWGPQAYNVGAGLFRLSNFAGYVKYNMPLGTTWENPKLSDEEAWDLAAFVNQMPRPGKDLRQDWPRLAGKPFDHPFGPYADPFPESQHKFGPFQAIKAYYKKNGGK